MDLQEYQNKARSTAIYLDIEHSRIIYPALGIIGECGEVAEKIKKFIRDDHWDIKPERKAAIAKELGDCCWYLANICCDTNHDLEMVYGMRGAFMIHKIRELALPQLIIRMNKHASIIANILEQCYYQYDCNLTDSRLLTELSINLSYVVTCIEEIARRFDLTLEEIYTANIEKLAGRKQKGTLTGDGDKR